MKTINVSHNLKITFGREGGRGLEMPNPDGLLIFNMFALSEPTLMPSGGKITRSNITDSFIIIFF